MLLWVLRGLYGAVIVVLAITSLVEFQDKKQAQLGLVAFGCILATGAATIIADVWVRRKHITTLSAIYFGLLLGFLLSSLIWSWLEPMLSMEGNLKLVLAVPLRLLITLICCYVTISTLLQTKDEFRFIIPYVEFSPQTKGGRPLVLDTSVIIDGRIADICDTRIIDSQLIVPRFVLQELQAIADSSDKLKRNRGRRGLDMLKKMQNNDKVELEVHEAKLPELRDVLKVDERLVVLAKALGGKVVTNDFNLNKIAQLQGVEVVNLNEVSNALKSVALPGEALMVRVVKPGDQVGQGVGYLEDGTMVVVEQGRSHIGQEIAISVKSVLQTPAGRMIFGQVDPRQPTGERGAVAPPANPPAPAGAHPPPRSPAFHRRLGVFPRRLQIAVWMLLIGPTAVSLPAAAPPAPAVPKPTDPRADIELVERLLAARRDYQGTLEQLRSHYLAVGEVEKARWAEDELRQYHRLNKPAYVLELDVPPPTLHAAQNFPEANELYRRAMTYKDKGWGNEYVDNQRRAEILLQQLLTQYPQSDKIGDAAYQLGDLYEGRAYKQPRRAAQYYERAFQWNPNTGNDARMRAARIYDRVLVDRAHAVELYRDVTLHSTDPKQLQEAQKRLADLAGGR